MLIVVQSMRDLQFGQIMAVYEQSNQELGQSRWLYESQGRQLALAEQDFFEYLRHCFFTLPGAVICTWQVNGRYVCALRSEPWQDGVLLTGLETAPGERGKGYACALIRAVQEYHSKQGNIKLYSHIRKGNSVSVHVHEKCGFRYYRDYAVFLDGSVDRQSATFIYEK